MANQSKRKPRARASQQSAITSRAKKNAPGQLRIVAGRWRGRKIPVIDADGLRPTGDRVRETLFNWLQLDIPGSRCLDLFAGSGALGLEAASRGAADVTLVEASTSVQAQLRQTLDALQAANSVMLFAGTAQAFLESNPKPFDLVFVDPPFQQQLHRAALQQIGRSLNSESLVYVECPDQERDLVDEFSGNFELVKEKQFGDVAALLLRFRG